MRRSPPGTHIEVAAAGERFRAFVPAPLPPDPPIVWSPALVRATALTAATVNKSLAHLEGLGVVAELTNRQRGRIFSYRRYVDELAAELERAP